MSKIKQSTTHEVIDNETGEVNRVIKNQTINWGQEPPYIKFYLEDICYLKDIPKTCSKVLLALLAHVSYADADEGMVVQPTGYTRSRIMNKLGYTNTQSLTNALTQLTKGGVLIKLSGGAYRLNPYLFGKGNWADIARLRTTIIYDLKGRTFKTDMELKDPLQDSIKRYPVIKDSSGTYIFLNLQKASGINAL